MTILARSWQPPFAGSSHPRHRAGFIPAPASAGRASPTGPQPRRRARQQRPVRNHHGFQLSAIFTKPSAGNAAAATNPHRRSSVHRFPAGSFFQGFRTPALYRIDSSCSGRHPKPFRLAVIQRCGDDWLHEVKYDGHRIRHGVRRAKRAAAHRPIRVQSHTVPARAISRSAVSSGASSCSTAEIAVPDERGCHPDILGRILRVDRDFVRFTLRRRYVRARQLLERFPHGMPTTEADTINADPLALIKS